LVVDDDDIVRESVARVLRFGGFTTFTEPDGASALRFVEQADPSPALVLMDESMPGMDGTTVRKQINKVAPGIRIVMISGHTGIDRNGEGVHGALEKPVRADVLLDAVRETLGLERSAT
jgi:DNA-binding NtrC family response regulator